jgi:hypothetical protein
MRTKSRRFCGLPQALREIDNRYEQSGIVYGIPAVFVMPTVQIGTNNYVLGIFLPSNTKFHILATTKLREFRILS